MENTTGRREDSFGQWLNFVRDSALKNNIPIPGLETRGAPAGAGEQVPSDGGFLVPPEFRQDLIERVYLDEVIGRCFDVKTSSNQFSWPTFLESSRANGSRFGGVESAWENEADTLTATKPKFGKGTVEMKKLIGLVYLTDELSSDVDMLTVFGPKLFAKEMAFRLTDAIVNGDGSGKPQGVLSSGALISVPKQAGQANGTVVSQNIVDMFARCWAGSRSNAVWLVHPEAEKQIIEAALSVGTGGSALPLYQSTPADVPFNNILGRPAIPLEQCQVPGTLGDVMLVDFSRYLLATRSKKQEVSIHVKFLTDEIAFRFVWRVDGQMIDQVPITPFTGTTTVSSCVALAAR